MVDLMGLRIVSGPMKSKGRPKGPDKMVYKRRVIRQVGELFDRWLEDNKEFLKEAEELDSRQFKVELMARPAMGWDMPGIAKESAMDAQNKAFKAQHEAITNPGNYVN